MAVIYAMIGLRGQHLPTKTDEKILYAFMRVDYGHKTLDEIVLAFRLAITAKLDLKLEDVKVYDQFTCEYLARVMSAYRIWLKNENKEIKKPVALLENKRKEPSREEMMADIAEYVENPATRLELTPTYVYWYLVKTGALVMTDEEKWEYFKRAADYRLNVLKSAAESDVLNRGFGQDYTRFLNMHMEENYSPWEASLLKLTARQMMVFDYVKNQKDARSKKAS